MKTLGLLTILAKAELTWLDWMGVTMVLTLSGLFTLARERARRHTLTAAVCVAEAGTVVVDRWHGRTLMVVKPVDRDTTVLMVPLGWPER